MYEDFFADRLIVLRTQRNVSAREMSLAIGQNSSYINRIENKLTFPSMQSFFYICEYLKISPQDFFDTSVENPERLNYAIDEMKKLNSSQLDVVITVIDGLKKK